MKVMAIYDQVTYAVCIYNTRLYTLYDTCSYLTSSKRCFAMWSINWMCLHFSKAQPMANSMNTSPYRLPAGVRVRNVFFSSVLRGRPEVKLTYGRLDGDLRAPSRVLTLSRDAGDYDHGDHRSPSTRTCTYSELHPRRERIAHLRLPPLVTFGKSRRPSFGKVSVKTARLIFGFFV